MAHHQFCDSGADSTNICTFRLQLSTQFRAVDPDSMDHFELCSFHHAHLLVLRPHHCRLLRGVSVLAIKRAANGKH